MRVAHYCRAFSPTSQTFVYEYISELERQALDNYVVTHSRENVDARPFPKVQVVERPNRWHPRRLWHRVLVPLGFGEPFTSDWPQTRDRLETVLREIGPEVIHAHFGKAAVQIAPVESRLNLPLVVSFYGHDISSLPKQPFWEDAYGILWTQADRILVLSEQMKMAAKNLGCPLEKLSVVHLSRDLNQFPFQAPERPTEKVLFVGRLVPKKAPLDAVRAIERANAQGAELQLQLVGDGPLREEVEDYVHENELSGTVSVRGRIPSSKIGNCMQEADIFLLPSKTAPSGDQEGTPTVLVEAQATGLPCVSTRHAGIPEMIPEVHHDLLAPEGDIEALARNLARVASWPTEKLCQIAERGQQKVEQEFCISEESRKIKKIYEEECSLWKEGKR
jgi:glycosyltransferase involved in cell wall biosynthesis